MARIRDLAKTLADEQIADALNREGRTSPRGKAFSASMIKWVRYQHAIAGPQLKRAGELTVDQLMEKFGASRHVVYYWIERGILQARRVPAGAPFWNRLDAEQEQALCLLGTELLTTFDQARSPNATVGGAL